MSHRRLIGLCVLSELVARPVIAGTINATVQQPGARYVPALFDMPVSTVVSIVNLGSTDLIVSSVGLVGSELRHRVGLHRGPGARLRVPGRAVVDGHRHGHAESTM